MEMTLPYEAIINGSRVRFTNHARDRADEREATIQDLRDAAETDVRAWAAAVKLSRGLNGRALKVCLRGINMVLAHDIDHGDGGDLVVIVSMFWRANGREKRGQRKRWARKHHGRRERS